MVIINLEILISRTNRAVVVSLCDDEVVLLFNESADVNHVKVFAALSSFSAAL